VEDTASALRKVIAQGGWPSPEAIAAAVAAHAAVIAWLIAHPAASHLREESTTLSVALVAPPPGAASPAETAQPNESSAPAPAGGDEPKSLSKPRSSDPASPAETAQPNELTAPAVADADKTKRLTKPRSHSEPSHIKPRPKPKEDASTGVYGSEGTQELPEGTAAYRVFVGNGGAIQDVVLMRSSGDASYDAAGVTMIRDSMTFDPPRDRASGTVATIVTISFSPEH
jgi:outer membrane biosynthesis protein TonB